MSLVESGIKKILISDWTYDHLQYIIFGLVFLFCLISVIIRYIKQLNWPVFTAEIIEHIYHYPDESGGKHNKVYHSGYHEYRVKFYDDNYKLIETSVSSNKKYFNVGDKADIKYNSESNEILLVKSFITNTINSVIFLSVLVLFLLYKLLT